MRLPVALPDEFIYPRLFHVSWREGTVSGRTNDVATIGVLSERRVFTLLRKVDVEEGWDERVRRGLSLTHSQTA